MSHKENISNGMKEYWKGIPNKPNDGDNENV